MKMLGLVGYFGGVCSRHRDSLPAMVRWGEQGGEEARVVTYLGHELRGLQEMMMVDDEERLCSIMVIV